MLNLWFKILKFKFKISLSGVTDFTTGFFLTEIYTFHRGATKAHIKHHLTFPTPTFVYFETKFLSEIHIFLSKRSSLLLKLVLIS